MTTQPSSAAKGGEGHGVHVVPISHYLAVFAALMVFTAVTVWVAFHDFGSLNTPIALVIAVVKATMVVLVFMHVRHGSPLVKLIVVSGLLWLLILFVFTMADYIARGSPTGV